jgi:glycosyltransferase involved in cell wall biosynthesis
VRIVIDVTPLSHPRTGIGNYMVGMLGGLTLAARGRHELVLFAPTGPRNVMRLRSALDEIPGDRRLVVVPPPSNVWRKLWSRTQRMPVEWLVGGLDVFHFSDWMYPPQRGGLRTTTVHDLVPLNHPEWVGQRTLALHVPKYHHAAEFCDVIFTISCYTADDVERTLGFPSERIVVAHPGIHERFRAEGPAAELGGPYLFTAATIEPRKNLNTLLEAFKLLRAKRPDLQLAVAGAGPPLKSDGVRALGYVRDDELSALYRGAEAFVYPSLFEGFGIPIVEAMASGVPAVVSSHPSMDEASGDAAVRVDPQDARAIAVGIERATEERETLIPRGREHSRRFTWGACGEAMLRGYEGVRG